MGLRHLQRFLHHLNNHPLPASLGLFVAALALRLLVNWLALGPAFMSGVDSSDYLALGERVARGNGFFNEMGQPTAYRPPLYPMLIGLVFMVSGIGNLAALKVVESILGALLCVLIGWIGRMLLGKSVGLLAGTVCAVYPFLIYYTGAVSTENLFTFLLALFVYLLVRGGQRTSKGMFFLAGVVLGLATLTRPTLLIMPPFLLVWAWVRFRQARTALLVTALVTVAMVAAILPWSIRNWMVMGKLIIVSTNGGTNFWGANNPLVVADRSRAGRWVPFSQLPHADELKQLNEVERSDRMYQLGMQFIRGNPAAMPRLLLAKLGNFWDPLPNRGAGQRLLSVLSYGLLMPFTLLGLVIDCRRGLRGLLLLLIVIVFMINTLIFWGGIRMRLPIEPYMIVYAAFGLTVAMGAFVRRFAPLPVRVPASGK